MDMKNIEAFLKIVQTGSFSTAAESLFITQSTISNRIHILEKELNTELFARMKGKKIALTTDGESIFPLLNHAYTYMTLAKSISLQKKNQSYEFEISFPAHMAEQLLFLTLLKGVQKEFKQLEFSFRLFTSKVALKELLTGSLDMAFCYFNSPPVENELHAEHIADIDTIIVCSNKHPLLKQMPLKLEELNHHRIIIYHNKFPTYTIFSEFLLNRASPFEIKYVEVQKTNIIKNMVKEEGGIALVQEVSVREELNRNEITKIILEEDLPKTPIYLIYKKHVPQDLTQYMVSFAKKLYLEDKSE